MKTGFLALALALILAPVAAIAQNAPPDAPPALTDQQRQEMFQTFKTIHTQEEALHKTLRAQVLGSLTPIHKQTIANLIGQLAVSANPDKDAVEKQIDVLLSPAEKSAILNAHNNYLAQSRTLHQQAMQQMQKFMPAGGPMSGEHHMGMNGKTHKPVTDPGEILMRVLTSDDSHGMHGMMMPMGPPMGRPPH
jgi:hypothetical protein